MFGLAYEFQLNKNTSQECGKADELQVLRTSYLSISWLIMFLPVIEVDELIVVLKSPSEIFVW